MAVAIKKKPTGKVTNMSAPKRNTSSGLYHMQTTWKVPSSLTSEKSDSRATTATVRTDLDCWSGGKFSKIQQTTNMNVGTTEIVKSLDWIVVGSKTWRRSDFWPLTDRQVVKFWSHVQLGNDKGKGPWQSTSAEFKFPRKPSISQIVQGRDSGDMTCTVTTNAGNDLYERYDTQYIVDVYNGTNGKTWTSNQTSRSTSFTVTADATVRSLLTYDQYLRMRIRARARGIRGNSDWVERNYYVSWPPLPVIKRIDVSTTDPSGKVTVEIDLKQNDASKSADWNTTYNTQHPVTGCRLEILRNSEASTPQQAAASESWTSMEYSDDGRTYALSATVTDLASERGLHSWVRVKSWNDIEELFYRYSTPVEVEKLFLAPPSQSESDIDIISANSGGNGSSAVLTLGWNASGEDTMTGTEISWSDNPNAWRSTVEPDTHEFTWSDGELVSGATTYHDSATIYVDGLTSGTLYHFRARRFQDRDSGDRLYGQYNTDVMTAIPTTSPSSVTLHAPSSVAVGRPLEITWSYDSESMQTEYEIITGTVENAVDSEGNVTHWIAADGLKIVAMGNDSRGSFVVPSESISGIAVDNTLALAVRVSTGGAFVASQATIITIDMPPVAELQVSTVTEQGSSISLASNVGTAMANVSVVAQGADGSMPDGSIAQVNGDVVWAASVMPAWVESNEEFSAQLALPSNLSLYDGASYDVNVTLVDSATGLSSEQVSDEFVVSWEHQAPKPSDLISVVGSDTTDSDGLRTVSATITLHEPDGATEGDLYDVYRVLDDEVQLIAEGRELDGVVVDNFAPFGNRTLAYRVACRTADGDVDWDDYEYELLPRKATDGIMVRIDFGGRYVELDRGVSYSDRRAKTFAGRSHMGEMTQRGYWGDEIKRSGQSAAAVVMVYERELADALDALAVHRGPCYVRLSTGVAYEADVQVSGPNVSVNSAGMQYSLAMTKVALTQEYVAVPIETHEEQQGGE